MVYVNYNNKIVYINTLTELYSKYFLEEFILTYNGKLVTNLENGPENAFLDLSFKLKGGIMGVLKPIFSQLAPCKAIELPTFFYTFPSFKSDSYSFKDSSNLPLKRKLHMRFGMAKRPKTASEKLRTGVSLLTAPMKTKMTKQYLLWSKEDIYTHFLKK